MATHTNLSSLFTDIADSIRSVSGGTASIQADTFPTAIQSLGSGFAKIQTGSYVGTGTYGASNPCSLTFDYQPEFAVITWNAYQTHSSILCKGIEMAFSEWNNAAQNTFILVNWENNNIIKWYLRQGNTGADYQLNQNNTQYLYFAIVK